MKLETLNKKVETLTQSGTVFPVRFKSRSGTFGGANWCIDLVNETGHSYHWWTMLKRINGVLVLNTYNYSPTTIKHIHKARSILGKLGIRYIDIETPRGLQDLESAAEQAAYLYGKAFVENKYARKPYKYALKYAEKQIANLKRIGVRVTKRQLQGGIAAAESARLNRLRRAKERREALKVVATPGLTVIQGGNTSENSVA